MGDIVDNDKRFNRETHGSGSFTNSDAVEEKLLVRLDILRVRGDSPIKIGTDVRGVARQNFPGKPNTQ